MSILEQPIRPKKLHEQAAERVQALILERQLKPGDRLPSERELQTMFGIGRPAVREALLLLERSGLIVLRGGSPATVADADPESIIREMGMAVEHFLSNPQGVKELQMARRLLECGLVRRAAQLRSDGDLALMLDILEKSKNALGDKKTFELLDVEFHFAIVQISGSRLFNVVFQATHEWLRQQRNTAIYRPDMAEVAMGYHHRIYKAIEERDSDAAAKAMNDHLDKVEQAFWEGQEAAKRGQVMF